MSDRKEEAGMNLKLRTHKLKLITYYSPFTTHPSQLIFAQFMKYFTVLLAGIFFLLFNSVEAQLTFPHVKVVYDSGWSYKNLTLIPIRFTDSLHSNAAFPRSFLSLSVAMQQKKIKITENKFDGRENVNTLNIRNLSKEYILVESGDLLKGGKQDRMSAETKLIAPGSDVNYLNVFCIEKGRWDKKAKPFSYAGFADATIRKAGDSSGVQQHVWREIEKQFVANETLTETYPYLQLQKKKTGQLNDYQQFFINRFKQSDSVYAGFIVLTDSTILAADIFANEYLLASSFEKLLSSYIGAIKNKESTVKTSKETVQNFARKLLSTESAQKKFVEHHGKIFLYKNYPLHITTFGN